VAARCGISKSTAHKICTKKERIIKTVKKCGRPASLNEREERKLLQTFKILRKKYVHFSVKDLMADCGFVANKVHPRTISRYLNKHGFRFRQARKKGLLNESDERLRTSYARKMKFILQSEPDFYTNHLAFYLDGVSFIHKNDPRKAAIQPKSRVWRKRGEGLSFTAKGSKSLAGGRRLHIIVAIASQKGVILRKDYDKMDGVFFAKCIRENFNLCFGKAGPKAYGKRLFLMDNDPSQTSKKAM
jgi:transposase